MLFSNRLPAALFGCMLVFCLNCGGGGGSTPIVQQPPTALSYTTSAAVYPECVAIIANNPSSSGGAVTSYSVSPTLPTGLNLNTVSGVISGTPTAATALASYTLTASNSAGHTTAVVTIAVDANTTPPVARVETPVQIVANMNPGWNLGNTLEGIPTEGDWGNPPVIGATFDDVKSIGYKSVRIPVYFGGIHLGASNIIDSTWLQRVSNVVDLALARGLYVIVDMHRYDLLCGRFQDNPAGTINKIATLWKQIAIKLRDKSPKVIFEVMNEPGNEWATDQGYNLTADQMNQLNDAVFSVVRASGGINATRCILMPMRYTSTYQAANLVLPSDDNLIVTFHWYTPWTFAIGNNDVFDQTYGSAADKTELDTQFNAVKSLFSDNGIPVIVGEFGCPVNRPASEPNPRNFNPPYYQWLWVDSVAQKAQECGFTTMIWDNGELLNRATHVWRDSVRPQLQIEAALGNKNSFVNTDQAYTLTISSADLVLPLVLNGNTLSWIKNADTDLVAVQDYSVTGSTLTIKGSYLGGLPSGATTLGIGFSAGANQLIRLSK